MEIVPCVPIVLCACYVEICDWLNDWGICCWREYMILGWKGEGWTCDAWLAMCIKVICVHMNVGLELMWCLFDLIVYCEVIIFDEQCVLVMQCICVLEWMSEV